MAVKLSWTAPANAAKVTIYRATTPIKHNALPTPLAELGPTEVTYSDATAIRNKVYHYVVAVEAADGTVRMTQSQSHGYFPDTGPGPTALIRGTYDEGYFGTMSSAELFSSSSLGAAMKLVSPTVDNYFTWSGAAPVWDKFALDGKILLIPRTSIALVQPRHLYYTGFMYGTDDNGKYPADASIAGVGVANQKRIVERDGYRYRVRTIRSSSADTDQLVDTSGAQVLDITQSEYGRTKGRMFRDLYLSQNNPPRWGNQIGVYGQTNSSTFTQTCNLATTNSAIVRGYGSGPDHVTAIGVTAVWPWCPVLELEL